MLLKLEGFKYASLFVSNVGYYHIQLIEDASNVCKIITPYVKYHYNSLPVQVRNSPDTFQQRLNDFFQVW